ncbi:MAG: hypothetical protein LBF37_01665 [Rickettsiales bacterium]|nr:hypothetical protein [Rickettsiales bacterium]
MKVLKNTLSKFVMAAMAMGILMPVNSFAAKAAVRDKTLDYECRPRWDRFIVDVNTTNWDKDAIACYDKDGNEIDPSKLYGAPKMYGEFEVGADGIITRSSRSMYGSPDGATDYSKMYGKYDPSQSGVKAKPQPVRVAAPAPKKSNAKELAKPKPVVKPKHTAKPIAPVVAKPEPKVEQTPPPAPVIPVIEEPKPVVKAHPAPKPVPAVPAQNIAKSLNEKIVTEESYCTEINPAVKGQLPKGIVLMTGRPDLMSCVKN